MGSELVVHIAPNILLKVSLKCAEYRTEHSDIRFDFFILYIGL